MNHSEVQRWLSFIQNYSKRFAEFKFKQLSGNISSEFPIQTLREEFTSAVTTNDLIHLHTKTLKGNQTDDATDRIFLYLLRSHLEWDVAESISENLIHGLSETESLSRALNDSQTLLHKLGFKSPCEAFARTKLGDALDCLIDIATRTSDSENIYRRALADFQPRPSTLSQLQRSIYDTCKPVKLGDINKFTQIVWRLWKLDKAFQDSDFRLSIGKYSAKKPRSFCVADSFGEAIYVYVAVRPDWSSFSTFLHELGHALHIVWAKENKPYENIHSPAYSSEGVATLFGLLVKKVPQNNCHTILEDPKKFELWVEYTKRRSLVLALLESVFYGAGNEYLNTIEERLDLGKGGGNLPELYEKLCQKLLLVHPDDGHPVRKITLEFYNYQYLKALEKAIQVGKDLETGYGSDWHKNINDPSFINSLCRKFY